MTTVADILKFVETLAPRAMKMEWDNVGLLCGSKNTEVTKVLVALDPFEGVCHEAAETGAQLIVTHHPLIFRPQKAVTDETSIGRSIMFLCRNGISAINAHTNLDQVSGGVNDVLAEKLGLQNIQIINPVDGYGLLRCGDVKQQPLETFLATVKEKLGCDGLRYVNSNKSVCKVAVGGGSCADEMMEAFAAGCDTFVTADIKYNQFWDAYDIGMAKVMAKGNCFGKVFIKAERNGNGPCNLRDLKGVGKAGSVMVAFRA
ncbi:MAG: Nif3-like dinuclear metal center hexameric protein [Oscillospiraceae bacterium]|nr:Nif3-like dinuclear metal center hexameric protein [Oscillospiraceae bacterium]